ncbi:MAG: hypothetical protein K8S25_14095 [Alphaproteobacteria bacterium]|nr:hypothetical protein [Alphaproteobacteria bacterium]
MSLLSKRTPARDITFFLGLANAHAVAAACRASGYAVPSVYRWRKDDADFAARWNDALVMAGDLLEEEADRRGRLGIDQPVFYQGRNVGTKKRYSDPLLMARLKAVRPEYRERSSAPSPFAAPPVQTVVVRDFLMEHEVLNLLSAGKLSLDALSESARGRIEKLRNEKEK